MSTLASGVVLFVMVAIGVAVVLLCAGVPSSFTRDDRDDEDWRSTDG